MAITLILDADHRRIAEPGYARDCRPAEDWQRYTGANVVLEPFTRTVMLQPLQQPQPMTTADWATSDDNFRLVGPAFFQGQPCFLRTDPTTESWVESRFQLSRNRAFCLSLYLYLPPNPGIPQQVRVFFGGRYCLLLERGRQAQLLRALSDPPNWDTTYFDYPSYTWTKVAEGTLFPESADFNLRELKVSVVYLRRNRLLIVSNLGAALQYREEDARRRSQDEDIFDVAMEAPVRVHVTTGAYVVAFCPIRFAQSGYLESPTYRLPYESTQEAEVLYEWEQRPGTDCSLIYTKGDGKPAEPPMKDFRYRVTLTSDGEESPYFYRCQVEFSPTSAQVTGLNLDASDDVTLVEESRSLERSAQRLTLRLRDPQGIYQEAARANAGVAFALDSVPRFFGYVDAPLAALGHAAYLDLQLRDRWKRVQNTLLTDAELFDGQKHTDVVKKVLRLAGFAQEEIEVDDDDYPLPSAEEDEAPLWQPAMGESAASFLEHIREEFSGWRLGVHGDGVAYYQPPASGSVVRAFGTITADLGPEDLPVFSMSEALDETQHRNEIWVIGQRSGGELLVASWVDYSSIYDTTAFQYVGERRPLVLIDTSLNTAGDVAWVCRTLADNFGQLRTLAVFEAPFDPTLYPDDLVTVDGSTYRLLSMETVLNAGEGAAGQSGRTRYEAELLA